MIVIIDYNMGNVRSVYNAIGSVSNIEVKISRSSEDLSQASHIILPGVGAFAEGMKNLKSLNLLKVLNDEVILKKKPFLGICLGMQLLAETSYENGEYRGLGFIKGKVEKIVTNSPDLRVPHIGWNETKEKKEHPLMANIKLPGIFYFVHSYFFNTTDDVIVNTFEYGKEYTATIASENIYGVQFHPEKSQKHGLQLLTNFLSLS